MMARLLEQKDGVAAAALDSKIEMLTPADWSRIQQVLPLFKPPTL
jgi:hypothetical protein